MEKTPEYKGLERELKQGIFHQIYLLTGPEDYLRHYYRDRIREALMPGESMEGSMNLHYYRGREISEEALIDLAETMPFFAERRVIILEETAFFKKGWENEKLAAYLASPAPTVFFIFVEREADKRTKLVKAIGAEGMVVTLEAVKDRNTLFVWLAQMAAKAGKKLEASAAARLLDFAGTDMMTLKNEMEKLICYCMERDRIGEKDVLAICIDNPEDRVFAMIDSISEKQLNNVMKDYQELLLKREAPLKILSLVARQYRILLHFAEGRGNERNIAKALGIRDGFVQKYRRLAGRISREEAMLALEKCAMTDESIKTGRISDQLGIETLLVELAG